MNNMMDTNSSAEWLLEADFGPAATGRFDFTLAFEGAILSIVPSALFLLLAPQRLVWLMKQPRKVAKSPRSILKLGLIGLYTALQLSILLYWALGPVRTAVQTAAGVLVFVSGLLLLVVSHAEHARALAPSTVITVYLLFTLLFDAVMARTLWLLHMDTGAVARLFTAAVVLKLLVLAAEAWEKRSILLARYQNLSPEMTSSILSHGVYWWLNPLLRTGFGRFLTMQDMYPIHEDMVARKLLARAQKAWASANQSRKHSLASSTVWANKSVFSSGVLARLFLIAFKYSLPFLIKTTTSFSGDASQPDAVGWALTGAWFLALIGRAISNAFYYQRTYRFVTSVRGSLCTQIFCKTLDLSVTALDESIAVTLMSTDTETICQTSALLHELWASPIECGVALYLLYQNLGPAAVAPIVVTIGATVAVMQLASYTGQAQRKWVRSIQTRVDVTASVLGSMKEVKMLALSDIVSDMVQGLRVKELRLSKDYRKLLCLRVLIGGITQVGAPLATFATFVIMSKTTGQPLDTGTAYASLSLIYLLTNPIVTFLRAIPMTTTALACFGRIQKFLLSESRADHRLPLLPGDSPSGEASTDVSSRPRESGTVMELQNFKREPVLPAGAPLVVVSDASFGWTRSGPPILKDIPVAIRRAHFTFIIGNVGAGKSTLMKAMLGETQPCKGFVYTGARNAAYVGQTPWIQNLTIRKNILGVSSYDRDWYGRVVHACGLEQDIRDLPSKDATKAGSAGVSLSGGQQQRLALARAVYSREQILFLDDVFSGQDAATAEHVQQALFADGGLFREMGTTVVCITSTIHTLAHADHIIALSEDGRVLHQGSFQQLHSETDYLQGLNIIRNGSAKTPENAKPPKTDHGAAGPDRPPPNTSSREPDPPSRAPSEFATYRYYFSTVRARYLVLFIASISLFAGGYKMTELLLSFWTGHEAPDESTNSFYLGLYGLFSGVALASMVVALYVWGIVLTPQSSEVLHARLLRAVIRAPLAFFSGTDVGVTTNRFSQDMSIIDTELPFELIDLSHDLFVLVMGGVLMTVFSGYFAALLPPVVLFCWLLQKFYLRTSRQIRLLDLEAKSPLFTQFLDLLQGLASVRAFAWEEPFREQYLELLDASQRPYYLLFCVQRWLGVVLELMVAVLAALLLVLVVKLRAQFSPHFVALAVLNVMSFSQMLAAVIQEWTQCETAFGSVARVKAFCDDTQDENLPAERLSPPEQQHWPARGHVVIENLVAAYTAGGAPVVRGVSLDMPAGAKVGICGRSGSGKSSLLGTLLRLLEMAPGSRVRFDGVDIATLPRQAVRAAVAVVPQHPFFLKNRSIRENLVPHRRQQESSDERILAVLRRLNMGDVVERLGGLESQLDADRLSQGQRQLLCLARAILADKKIVLLDEASSNIDERSERLIRDVIREQFVGCTVIAIVHRLGAVADFDHVAVMSGGRLVEWDSPQALLARDSEFKRLWDLGTN
ncbi:P-loop containing nucleoside triphosphate hydrolase protein [Lasiosphaeria miniovina]|uniref:P-loop containing nucleoside triphosphate hydrolase protein n=1 Tax=Lasiosphaeria miniovina TaxID=1954250 RepID=A0AA40DYX3_9PEZI|nr:P-loop containing nucleoside triphosphate hydrolase protein [Lasiosphaeria miniovina]KAK0718041.1 P-loop containing nucleoside triphosphate hydrolase protein [Lasiosphaeria miniovina]